MQFVYLREFLYTGSAPQATPRKPRLVRRACARARVDLCKDNTDACQLMKECYRRVVAASFGLCAWGALGRSHSRSNAW